MTYAVNQEKWSVAEKFCSRNNMTFEIWTEVKLKKFGILSFEVDKGILMQESKSSSKPVMKHLTRRPTNRPKRKS